MEADRSRRDTRLAIEASLLPTLFEGDQVAMIAMDVDGRVTALTPSAERLLGYAEDELRGVRLHERLHYQRPDGDALAHEECPIMQALAAARPASGDGDLLVRKDGTTLVVSWTVAPMVIANSLVGAMFAFHDVQARHDDAARHEQRLAAAEAANLRLALLADATQALAAPSTLREGLQALSRLVVPVIADWAVIDLLDEEGRLERVALAHRSPTLEAQGLTELGELPAPTPDVTSPLAHVLAGGPVHHGLRFPPVEAATDPLGAARLALFHRLGAAEAVTAPLRVRGRTLGAMTLVRVDPARPYQPEDLTFIGDLAARAATAVDTSWLLERVQRRAEQMQRSLLPQLPERLGGLSLAGAYRPASDADRVGGDWYDAFPLRDGSVALVVGDVVGHDLHAATRMGAVRHKLRAVAGDHVAAPHEVLARLDRVLEQFAPDDMATTVYARLTSTETGRVLEWSNAGHPPPLLLAPGYSPRLLDAAPDLPLGVADLPRTTYRLRLPPGATLVLYTDGLVEHSLESLTTSLARLTQRSTDLATASPEEVRDALLVRLAPAGRDDIALLIARLDE